DYARYFGLALDPFMPSSGTPRVYANGRVLDLTPDADLGSFFGFSDDEKRLGIGGMAQKYIGPALEQIKANSSPDTMDWPSRALAEYDRETWAEMLRRRGASSGAIQFFTLGAAPREASSLYILRMFALGGLGGWKKIRGGNDQLPRLL